MGQREASKAGVGLSVYSAGELSQNNACGARRELKIEKSNAVDQPLQRYAKAMDQPLHTVGLAVVQPLYSRSSGRPTAVQSFYRSSNHCTV